MSDTTTVSPGLNRALWGVQALLAFAFGAAGVMKATTPIADLAAMMPWVGDSPDALVRFIGVSEFLGAVGLILPSALRIQPKLTPIAASLLAVVMVLAAGMHASRGEFEGLPPNVVLGGLSAFVAWGRFGKGAIAGK